LFLPLPLLLLLLLLLLSYDHPNSVILSEAHRAQPKDPDEAHARTTAHTFHPQIPPLPSPIPPDEQGTGCPIHARFCA
jgi:hypothetical protein